MLAKKVAQGKALATIESAKWVGPFPAPFSCEIVETNEEGFAKIFCWQTKSRTPLAGLSK
jgi:glycine cleavage system H lipoate-binding protein